MKAFSFLGLAIMSAFLTSRIAALPLPIVAPEAVGISTERLERMHAMVQGYVDRGELAGVVTLIARAGQVADVRAYGWADLETKTPMRRDSLFRIASMTKVVTAVAVLQLFEAGRFRLDAPVGDFIPELRHMRVLTGGDATHPLLTEARPITVRHLLTHTAGFSSVEMAGPELRPYYAQMAADHPNSLRAFVAGVAQLPLANQPGEAFVYGIGYDVLGRFVEVVSGLPFERYVSERIFAPLAMRDTFFQVPQEKQARLARTYVHEAGKPIAPRATSGQPYYLGGPGYPRGSGGLVSTVDDYARFGQMLLNGGELDGARVLEAKTVRLMTTSQLTMLQEPSAFFQPHETYGFGVSVRVSLATGSAGSLGQFGWSGAATTYCSMDPTEGTVALFFAQHYPWNEYDVFTKFSTAFYQALTERRNQ